MAVIVNLALALKPWRPAIATSWIKFSQIWLVAFCQFLSFAWKSDLPFSPPVRDRISPLWAVALTILYLLELSKASFGVSLRRAAFWPIWDVRDLNLWIFRYGTVDDRNSPVTSKLSWILMNSAGFSELNKLEFLCWKNDRIRLKLNVGAGFQLIAAAEAQLLRNVGKRVLVWPLAGQTSFPPTPLIWWVPRSRGRPWPTWFSVRSRYPTEEFRIKRLPFLDAACLLVQSQESSRHTVFRVGLWAHGWNGQITLRLEGKKF